MIYNNIVKGIFIDRPNRFIALVEVNKAIETVHVKNTGRCKELLIKGATVFLEKNDNPKRKTKYSLISVYKGNKLINMDSQVPNKVVFDAIVNNQISKIPSVTHIKREVTFKSSRFDIYFEADDVKGFVEVKGVTLESDGHAMFPDAPTIRGTKHVNEMIEAVKEGYQGYIFFLIQMDEVSDFTTNIKTDKVFANAIEAASKKGVNILVYNSVVSENSIKIGKKVQLLL